MMDCNGWSPKFKSVVPDFRMHCVDPRGKTSSGGPWVIGGKSYQNNGRFMDNGHYVGHDEPSVKFISSAANSGNTMTYVMRMPTEPTATATNNGSVIHYAELSPAPWFGLPMCDPDSYPENPCTPDSDSNVGTNTANAAGSAFMELQLYPPGFTPFADDVSCSRTKWCAALTIDSLESKFNFADLNPDCEEPSNFAFLQRNGKPTGPPSPQLANIKSYTPNNETLLIGDGDTISLSITDPAKGFTATIHDLTTGQTGTMTASAANGFMNTSNDKACTGHPFTFHAEYATAAQQNQVPWAALQGGVLMEQETGHSEVCQSLTNKDPMSFGGYSDKDVYDTCVGGVNEGKNEVGEGGCNAKGICKNPTTEGTTGPIACPSDNDNSGQLCEFADGTCLPQGSRQVTVDGHAETAYSEVNFCQANRFQNGDLDFDGVPYQKGKWPNGSKNNPTSFRYAGPFDQAGNPYPEVQFETDIAGSEFLCNTFTGLNCVAPPLAAKFYPYWTMTKTQSIGNLYHAPDCTWNFGATIPGVTKFTFGGDAEYGVSDVAVYGGNLISRVRANPEVNASWGCKALKLKG